MEEGQISRRAFLRQFVILSMLAVGQAGCQPVPVYGVPIVVTVAPEYGMPKVETVEPTITPTTLKVVEKPVYGVEKVVPQVDRMVFLEENEPEKPLQKTKDVPVTAQFMIYFATAMRESSQDAVLLQPVGEDAIGFEPIWLHEQTALRIVPDAALQPATLHILEVGAGAKDSQGRSLYPTESARAEFTTAQS